MEEPKAALDNDDLGLIDKLVAAEEGMPALTAITGKITHQIELVGETMRSVGEELDGASGRSQGMKAQLVLTQRLAKQLNEPAREIETLGHAYAAELAKLDPGVHALLDIAAQQEASDDDAAEYLAEIQTLAETANESLTSLQGVVDAINQAATFSRSLKDPLRRMRTGARGVLDGRRIIEEWGRRAKSIEEHGNRHRRRAPRPARPSPRP